MSCGLTREELLRFDIPVVGGICKGPRPDGTTCDDPASAHSSGKINKFIPRSDRRLAESNFIFLPDTIPNNNSSTFSFSIPIATSFSSSLL